MKRLFSLLLLSIFTLSINAQAAYRDIPSSSKLTPTIQKFIDLGALEGQGFFRADSPVPATMFWQIVVADTGFDTAAATFETPVPAGVDPNSDEAQYLREAIRRGWLQADDYDPLGQIKRSHAIKVLVESKGILPPQMVSSKFREVSSGVSRLAKYYGHIEAAYASGLLKQHDVDPFRPNDLLTRRELLTWLQNWQDGGQQKVSTLSPSAQSNRAQEFPYQKRRSGGGISITTTDQTTIDLRKSVDEQVWDAVIQQINKKYKFSEQLTEEKKAEMINAGIAGLVNALDDKYSNYVTPDKSEAFLEGLEGEFEGIGAYVEMVDDQFTITSPIKGSPAEAAGLKAGDVVTQVDDEIIAGESIRDIIDKVRGPAGTKVKLRIFREFEGEKDYIVTRGQITIPALTFEMKNSVAIVGLHQFSRTSGRDLETLLETQVLPKKPRGIVFDLRNNPGGFLTAAVSVGEIFLNRDERIFSVEYKNKNTVYETEHDGLLSDYTKPMVFLQNKGSASASEILTGMVKDHKIGKVMGQISTGKGTVQEIVSFTNGGNLKLTVAKWLTPDGRWIHEVGVIPDVEIANPTDEEKQREEDPQLDAAIQAVLRPGN